MTEKIYALDLNSEEWVTWLTEELKQPKFRADQICQWIWEKKIFDTDEMTKPLAATQRTSEFPRGFQRSHAHQRAAFLY